MKSPRNAALMALSCVCLSLLGGTCTPTSDPNLLASQVVAVEGGGGGTNISFQGVKGQVVHIAMMSSVQPYGYLTFPDGNGTYTPPNQAANPPPADFDPTLNNHINQADFTLPQTGTYTLTVYDASNVGGQVIVSVSVVP